MAYNANYLVSVGGQSKARKTSPPGGTSPAGGGAVWFYSHPSDNLAAVKAAGYFNDARNILGPGDAIVFSANGAAVDIITVNAVPLTGNVTIQTASISSA